MPFSRYAHTKKIGLGTQYGTSNAHEAIRAAIKSGRIATKTHIIADLERLDHLAGKYYGDGTYWWIIAAASDIGWGLQLAPGTVVLIPNIADIAEIVG